MRDFYPFRLDRLYQDPLYGRILLQHRLNEAGAPTGEVSDELYAKRPLHDGLKLVPSCYDYWCFRVLGKIDLGVDADVFRFEPVEQRLEGL